MGLCYLLSFLLSADFLEWIIPKAKNKEARPNEAPDGLPEIADIADAI